MGDLRKGQNIFRSLTECGLRFNIVIWGGRGTWVQIERKGRNIFWQPTIGGAGTNFFPLVSIRDRARRCCRFQQRTVVRTMSGRKLSGVGKRKKLNGLHVNTNETCFEIWATWEIKRVLLRVESCSLKELTCFMSDQKSSPILSTRAQ